jgi:hypothetical protein
MLKTLARTTPFTAKVLIFIQVTIQPESSFAETIASKAQEESSDLLLLPWTETGTISEAQAISDSSVKNKLASASYADFVAQAMESVQCNTAVFINKGFSGTSPMT